MLRILDDADNLDVGFDRLAAAKSEGTTERIARIAEIMPGKALVHYRDLGAFRIIRIRETPAQPAAAPPARRNNPGLTLACSTCMSSVSFSL